jgi:SAM-dependent methyltransferase
MPDIEWNLAKFATDENHWFKNGGGEEWSEMWGNSEAQWFGSLYPRLHRFLPVSAILEIAPGFGRWTQFLLPLCKSYVGVDLSQQCVAACRRRFCDFNHASFVQNDGLTLALAEIPDERFGLVFSFDSLIHVERDVLESYVPQILRKLTPGGVAFLHHSNLAALPAGTENRDVRGESVSGDIVLDVVNRAGGKVLVQERICWQDVDEKVPELLTDCLTTLVRKEHPHTEPAIVLQNRRFMDEALIIRETHTPYCHAFAKSVEERAVHER